MTCEELRERYEAFAIGSLDPAEAVELREHLDRQCDICVPGVKRAMTSVAAMSAGVVLKNPPKRLRQRILALVNPKAGESKSWIFGWALAAVMAVALLSISIPARRQATETAKLEEALAILDDPTTKDVTFGTTEKPVRGRVFVNPTKGVVFIAASMPKLDAGKAYELWTIPASGKPVPQGTFKAQLDATALYVRSGAMEPPAAVALSIEPEAGSPQPTTTPFFVSKMGAF